nr:hypothetical protein Iba_chr06aCG13670 [Ipomoea batatas]
MSSSLLALISFYLYCSTIPTASPVFIAEIARLTNRSREHRLVNWIPHMSRISCDEPLPSPELVVGSVQGNQIIEEEGCFGLELMG